jgi:hypothetical protein
MKQEDLYRKLHSIQALEKGATTPGEKTAAVKARKRLLRKLNQQGILLDTRHLFERHYEPSLVNDPIHSDMALPSHEELMKKLVGWRVGDLGSEHIQSWAADIIDKMVLPNPPPDNPESIQVEVIFELSSLHQRTWEMCDIDELQIFLKTSVNDSMGAWRRWFAHIEASSARIMKVSA